VFDRRHYPADEDHWGAVESGANKIARISVAGEKRPDYDGDGKADLAVYRSATGEWFILNSSTSTLSHVNWGAPSLGDIPARR
jgi:hypothetical protein